MEALDILEKRIDSLNRVLGQLPDSNKTSSGEENLVDSLISANTLISSSLSGRENISKVVDRTAELERYLDPNYLDSTQEIKSKEVYVNTVAPELAANFEMLEKIKSLEPALGAEYFRNIPDATEKLKEMGESAAELSQRNELIEESLILAMQRYSEIQSGITESLRAMNERLDRIEEKLQRKKEVDVDV